MLPRVGPATPAKLLVPLALLVSLSGPPAVAFDRESPADPAKGKTVSGEISFYVSASGRPQAEELYRIEVASDHEFRRIVKTFEMGKDRAGWSLGDPEGIDNIPEKYAPRNFEGIHYRGQLRLADGTYYWRVLKSVGGGGFNPLRGVETFTVDTVPPEPIDTMRMRLLPDGRLQMYWTAPFNDAKGNAERVAGYRVYRYPRMLKRFPLMTRNLAGEVQDSQFVLPQKDDTSRITFFFVQAVDEAGNEEGRRRPAPLGSYQVAFDPPNMDEAINPENLKRMAAEEKAEEKAAASK